jgi:DNA-binding beta-propeller fold protein YncE
VPGAPVAAGAEPVDVFITPDGHTALVADFQTSVVTPISLPGLVPEPAIAVTGNPTGIAGVSPTTAYVSGGDSVTPLDLQSRQPGTAIDVGTTAEGLAVAPGGSTAWVCGGDGTLVHLSLATGSVIGRANVGNQPSAVVIAYRAAGD